MTAPSMNRLRVDVRALEKRHRAEFDKLHTRVLQLIKQHELSGWELGRVFRRMTDAKLYKAGGFNSLEDYAVSIGFGTNRANVLKAVSVFRREHVDEYGSGILYAILALWAVLPGREDPAHVDTFRFQIVVDGVLVERTLAHADLTIPAIEDATNRAKAERAKPSASLDAIVASLVALVKKAMTATAGFSVTAAMKKRGPVVSFFRVPFAELVRFWRALGLALLGLGQLHDKDRALLDHTTRRPPSDPALPPVVRPPALPALPAPDRAFVPRTQVDPRRPGPARPIRRPGLRRR